MLAFLCLLGLFHCALAAINTDVSQVIDATSSIVRYSVEIKASEVDGHYAFMLPNKWAQHLSFFTASNKGKELTVSESKSDGNFTTFQFETDASPVLKIKAVFTGLLTPYPTEISQSDQQLVLLDSLHYFYSPYVTTNQKSVYKLPSASIESFTKLSPHSVRGSSIHFGPFQNIPAHSISHLRIHFVNNFPFAKFSNLIKEIEVSHWGNVAIEEIYELQHSGAKLKGGFSRFDYQMKRMNQSPSFRSLIGYLPAQSSNIYYRDQIGNISTSDIRVNSDGDLELEVQTRFPMFGGWQTQFYIGYSVPTELMLFRDSTQTYTLKFDFFTIFKDVWIDDLEIKVVLPEGCTNIRVNVPYHVEESRSVRYTFLDSQMNGGRKVISLKSKNIVEEHDKKVTISYEFAQARMMVEPAMLVAGFLVFFFVCIVLSRVTNISSNQKNIKIE